MTRPALFKYLLTWRQHGTVLVDWADVEHVGDDVELDAGSTRWSALL